MDTKEIAELLGTTPRQLRQFLRSPVSTYVAVGSGARYEFTASDLPTLRKRFSDWKADGKPGPAVEPGLQIKRKPVRVEPDPIDEKVWAEEGPVQLEDIRDPRVRARVRADAQAAEDRLNMLLLSRNAHISQGYASTLWKRAS